MTIYKPGPRPGEALKSWPQHGSYGQENAKVAAAVRPNEVVGQVTATKAIRPWDPEAEDGSEVVFGVVLFGRAAGEDATVFTNDCEFKGSKLVTPTGANAAETAALKAQAIAGLLVRNKVR